MTTPPGAAAPGVPSVDGKPTFHHLNHSQSLRILWLLEELQSPYTLVIHRRIDSRAPPSLAQIHPLGKAPVLVTPQGAVLAESSTIIDYLLRHYDSKDHKFSLPPLPNPDLSPQNTNAASDPELEAEEAWLRQESLTSFTTSTFNPIITLKLILHIAVAKGPLLLRPLFYAVYQGMETAFVKSEIEKCLRYLEMQLGGKEWFSGREEPGKVDFVVVWVGDLLSQRGYVDWRAFGELKEWLERVHARGAYRKALEMGGGYDLATF